MIGLDSDAFDRWLAYRKSIKKPYKSPHSTELAQQRLASFGEWQMQVVEQSIERGWTGLFELPKRTLKDLKEKQRQADKDAILLANLRERAQKIGYRDCASDEAVNDYRYWVERAEREDADRRWRESRKGPQSIAALIGKHA